MSTTNVFLISLETDKATIITTYGETNNKRTNNLTNYCVSQTDTKRRQNYSAKLTKKITKTT
jgi:hypothetical protein